MAPGLGKSRDRSHAPVPNAAYVVGRRRPSMARTTTKQPQGEQLAEISNMVVSIYADYLGRGPTKARTFATDGVVPSRLKDTLPRAEQSLIQPGGEAAVLDARNSPQKRRRGDLV